MHVTAIAHAKERLKIAHDSVKKMEAADNFAEVRTAWIEFLHAVSSVYSKLEQGAKADGKSAAWYGRMKKERKDDPLLSYLHHARNADRYGLEEIVSSEGSASIASYLQPDGLILQIRSVGRGETTWGDKIFDEHGRLAGTKVEESWAKWALVVTVKDNRFGDSFLPPTHHLDNPIVGQDPGFLANLSLPYLSSLIDAGEGYVIPPSQTK